MDLLVVVWAGSIPMLIVLGIINTPLWASVFLLLWATLLAIILVRGRRTLEELGKLPPSPPSWPIIGHLHIMSKLLPHQHLAKLAKTYGPIMYLRLGMVPALVVSSPELAQLFLKVHDKEFSNRPDSMYRHLTEHGKGIIFADMGGPWRDIRRIYAALVLHPKLRKLKEATWAPELASMLHNVAQEQERYGFVNLNNICHDYVCSTISHLLFMDIKDTQHIKSLAKLAVALIATPVIGEFIPCLHWMDFKVKRQMKYLGSQIDSLIGGLINQRRKEKTTHTDNNDIDSDKKMQPPDFLDELLSLLEEGSFPSFNSDESVIHTCWDILAAAIDTTTTAMEWVIAELIANPNEMKRLQEDVNRVLPSDHQSIVTFADIEKMTYLKATIKESLRLHPPAALLLPHFSTSSSTLEVGGYQIPPKTRVYVNVWAMGRDPSIWEDPLRFSPKRFMEGGKMQGLDASGRHFELIPFGSGRRICLGIDIALVTIELGICNLVRAYDWTLPSGVPLEDLDMEEKPGITNARLHPLITLSKPRY